MGNLCVGFYLIVFNPGKSLKYRREIREAMIEYLLLAVAIIGSVIASYTDIKIREVSNTLSFGMIGVLLLLRVFYAVMKSDFGSLWGVLIVGAAFLGVGMVFFYTRQWGGADVKMLVAYGVGFGTLIGGIRPLHMAIWPFAMTLLLNLFIAAAVYSVGFAVWLAWKTPKAIHDYRASVNNVEYVVGATVFLAALMLSFIYPVFIWILFLPGLWFLIKFLTVVQKNCMYKLKKVGELVEFDVPDGDVEVDGGLIVNSKDPNGMSRAQVKEIIKLAKKGKLPKKMNVKWGVPLVPVFPVSLLISLFYGDLLYTFMAWLV